MTGPRAAACPACGVPVLSTSSGRVLDVDAQGPYDPVSGAPLSMAAMTELLRAEGRIGHRLHRCEAVQGALFGGGA